MSCSRECRGLMLSLAAIISLAGCGSQSIPPPFPEMNSSQTGGSQPSDPQLGGVDPALVSPDSDPGSGAGSEVNPREILKAVVQLVRLAPTNPGGSHIDIAKDYLNQFFASVDPKAFAMSEESKRYLREQLGEKADPAIRDLESPTFAKEDARHLEDCLLLNAIARHVAGDGDDLTRVRRLFDWLIRQVQLVPPGSLAPPGGIHAQARPHDVLMRGMGTELGGWAERSWCFISLCRQIGLDACLLVYTPPARSLLLQTNAAGDKAGQPAAEPVVWVTAVIIGGKPYLFDCRIGLPIPGASGNGVATLEEVLTNPSVLAQLELPGEAPLARPSDLASAKFTAWVDSTLGFLSPRMRELQEQLSGRDRMVLFRDPAEQAAALAAAIGPRFAGTALWYLPMEVGYRLFNDSNFVASTLYSIGVFDSKLPLLPARLGQLRGEISQAVESYSAFRFAERPVQNDGKSPIPPPLQRVLDLYATYFLGLAKLEEGQPQLAESFFAQTPKLAPELGPGQDYFAMYRWGARTNLGLSQAGRGDNVLAIRNLAEPQPTPQEIGNRLLARRLIWDAPFVPDADIPK